MRTIDECAEVDKLGEIDKITKGSNKLATQRGTMMASRSGWVGVALLWCATVTSAQEPPAAGAISGALGYPSEELPAMRVYAIPVEGKARYLVETQAKQSQFTVNGLPAGEYFVVAYVSPKPGEPGDRGAWTRFVQCGMKVTCTDHALVPVSVAAGKTTGGVYVADWYVPAGAFPAEAVTHQRGTASGECEGKGSQLELDACNSQRYEATDKSLNAEYRRVLGTLDQFPACKDRLKKAQLAWIKFRDDHCAYDGATGYKGRTTECLGELTRQRVDYLKQQAVELCNP